MWNSIVWLAGVSASLLLGVSYIPQILRLFKEKSAAGISLSFWLILDASLVMLFILALDAGQRNLIAAQGLFFYFTHFFGLALVVTAQVLYYKRRG